jgi:threonine/homoserine/homoserine lactone efflux protein
LPDDVLEGILILLVGAWFLYAGLRWGSATAMFRRWTGREPGKFEPMYRAINVGLGLVFMLLGLSAIFGLVKVR